jgi:glycosyltransferase involved in cell wall biosynthesis
MSVSLVISVYNDVLSLTAVLRSVKAQSFQKFEAIIAQDGDDTCFDALINTYNAFFPIQHLKQADEGFLKNRILNEAIRRANYDKMVFIDGDCFLHPHFLKAYNQSILKGKICMGRRIDLDPKTTALVKHDKEWNNTGGRVFLPALVAAKVSFETEINRL